ncbi:MAG: metalloenzyme [Chloroflexota bacterium]|nr:metalloenzyme [Chloroflexota bacterium]
MALIFVLIDGVGLAPSGPQNPVACGLPQLARFLGVPLTDTLLIETTGLLARPVDATLGVPGLPQSGSGHTAIYGGFNAAAANGRHQPSYPTIAMRAQLAQHNLLLEAQKQGARVAWANAYLPGYPEAVTQRRQRHTAGTWAALQAGLTLRGIEDLLAGSALSWDVSQQLARMRPGATMLPEIAPEVAGARLVRLARTHDLVAFETYLPDLAGHNRIGISVADALALVDGLLAGVLHARAAEDTLVVTSDHGNSEDTTTRIHTRNTVPLLAFGPAAGAFVPVQAIDGIAPALLNALQGA